MGSIRVKKREERLRRVLWRRDRLTPSPGPKESHEGAIKSQRRVLDQRGAMRESWRATTGSAELRSRKRDSVGREEPGKTHAESGAERKPRGSHHEPTETQL